MQVVFFQFKVVDERNCGVSVGEDVNDVVEGDPREDLLLVLGHAFKRGAGPLILEDVGEAPANPLELLVRMTSRHSSGVSAGAGVAL